MTFDTVWRFIVSAAGVVAILMMIVMTMLTNDEFL
jgi:hypothetical protein